MQRQRGELVPIGDALSGMGGPVKSIRDATPQAVHHFTLSDQVGQLVSASEADPERGFMARLLTLCSLPRTNPGNRKEYKRVNGPYKLIMIAGGDNKSSPSAIDRGPERQGYSLRVFESGALTLRGGIAVVPVEAVGGPCPSKEVWETLP